MNVGTNLAPAATSSIAMAGFNRTDISLPDAHSNHLTGPNGEGASVEVSISPQAHAMLAIDMDSLAAKGYTHVGIDTDGKPGAEISIDVKAGAGTVMVAPSGTESAAAPEAGALDTNGSMLDVLLQIMDANAEAAKEAEKTQNSSIADGGTAADAPATPAAPAASPKAQIAIVVKAYNATASL